MDTPITTTAAPAVRSKTPALPLTFGAILVSFFFSFVNISCNGQPVANLTGLQLALGTELKSHDPFGGEKTEKLPAQPLAALAFGAAVLGLLLSFGRTATRTLTMIAAGAGALLLLGLKMKLDRDIVNQGQGMLRIEYGGAFAIAVILFAAAAFLSYRSKTPTSP
jgi:hypothetical protein